MGRSFTAVSPAATLVRVRIPDEGEPFLMANGHQIASGVPTSTLVDGIPALDFGGTVYTPTASKETRRAISVTRPEAVEAVGLTVEDVDVLVSIGFLHVEGWPTLWALQLDERRKRARGWTFTDGVATAETWQIDLVAVKKRCCGRA